MSDPCSRCRRTNSDLIAGRCRLCSYPTGGDPRQDETDAIVAAERPAHNARLAAEWAAVDQAERTLREERDTAARAATAADWPIERIREVMASVRSEA